jgi:hypothetical protein
MSAGEDEAFVKSKRSDGRLLSADTRSSSSVPMWQNRDLAAKSAKDSSLFSLESSRFQQALFQ